MWILPTALNIILFSYQNIYFAFPLPVVLRFPRFSNGICSIAPLWLATAASTENLFLYSIKLKKIYCSNGFTGLASLSQAFNLRYPPFVGQKITFFKVYFSPFSLPELLYTSRRTTLCLCVFARSNLSLAKPQSRKSKNTQILTTWSINCQFDGILVWFKCL